MADSAPTTTTATASNTVSDVLVVGGGPAGLAAALPACRLRYSVTVLDAGAPRNAGSAAVHTVLSRDGHDPAALLADARAQLRAYPAHLAAVRERTTVASLAVTRLPGAGTGFLAVDHTGAEHRAKKLILATGSADVFPPIPGFADNWPAHLHQCLFCDGAEAFETGKPVGVLLPGRREWTAMLDRLVLMASRHTSAAVTVYTDGADPAAAWLRPALDAARALGATVEPAPIRRLVNRGPGPAEGIDVVLAAPADRTDNLAFLACKPETRSNGAVLLDQLRLDRQPGEDEVAVKGPTGATSVPGCFAAGDLVQPMLKQVTVAMYSGFMAGSAAVQELLTEEKEARLAGAA